MNLNRLNDCQDLLNNELEGERLIVLRPNKKHPLDKGLTVHGFKVIEDAEEWIVPEKLQQFIEEACRGEESIEEKMLKVYQEICRSYVYDDNALTYVHKVGEGEFIVSDAYGRKTTPTWKEKRKQHNRRICYEISRILAASIIEIIKSADAASTHSVFIIWDKSVTHYFVSLISDDYQVTLDIDDFTKLKDITRVKTGLTIEGIKIIYDPSSKFTDALKKANEGRSTDATEHIKAKVKDRAKSFRERLKVKKPEEPQEETAEEPDEEIDDVEFIKGALVILKEMGLDPAGVFEYMKEVVDKRFGSKSRKKVWKEIRKKSTEEDLEPRHTRCLRVTINNVTYIIDVTKDTIEEMFVKYIPEKHNSIYKEKFMRDFNRYDGN